MGRAEVVFLASPLTFRYGTFANTTEDGASLHFAIAFGARHDA